MLDKVDSVGLVTLFPWTMSLHINGAIEHVHCKSERLLLRPCFAPRKWLSALYLWLYLRQQSTVFPQIYREKPHPFNQRDFESPLWQTTKVPRVWGELGGLKQVPSVWGYGYFLELLKFTFLFLFLFFFFLQPFLAPKWGKSRPIFFSSALRIKNYLQIAQLFNIQRWQTNDTA